MIMKYLNDILSIFEVWKYNEILILFKFEWGDFLLLKNCLSEILV